MKLPTRTPKQQEIIELIYRFRFIDRVQIQKFLDHKDKRRINSWLKDLAEKKYVSRMYEAHKFGENTKPAVFRAGTFGIRFLKTQDWTDPTIVRKLYSDSQRSENFKNHCSLVVNCCLTLKHESKNGINYSFSTQTDFANPSLPFNFLKELNPQICFSKLETKNATKYYLVEDFESTQPRYMVKKRIREYIEFFLSGEWENHINNPFPVILLICPTKVMLINTKRTTRKLLEEEQSLEDLHIRFATLDEVKEFGITGEIWEEV